MLDNYLDYNLQVFEDKFMNIYSVYIDSTKKETKPLLIKQGFSFLAIIFNYLWALYHKMWLIALITISINIIIKNIEISHIAYSANIAILLLLGWFAPDLREYYAERKGFKLSDIILASSEEEAEVKYYMRTNS